MVFSVYFINRNICLTLISALQEVISLFVWPISWRKLSCYFGGGFIHVCRYSQLLQTAPTRLRKRWIRLLLVSLEWPGNFSPVIYRRRFFFFQYHKGPWNPTKRSEFAFVQSSSRVFKITYFANCRRTPLELEGRKENFIYWGWSALITGGPVVFIMALKKEKLW